MNRFTILKCVENSEKIFSNSQYNGSLIVLVSVSDPSVQIFFPLSKENGILLRQILFGEGKIDANTDVIGIYKTMLDSWRSSDEFLSGVIIDVTKNTKNTENTENDEENNTEEENEENEENEEGIHSKEISSDNYDINVKLCLVDQNGSLDGLVRVNLIHSIFLAAITGSDFVISDDFLEVVMPEIFGEDDDNTEENYGDSDSKAFPEDKGLFNIVKEIMNGKIKDD